MNERLTMPASHFLASLPSSGAGLLITDPPWDLEGAGRFDAAASYERLSLTEIARTLREARRVLVPGGHFYCFAPAGDVLEEILREFVTDGWAFLRILAWDKSESGKGLGAYRNSWEPVLIFSNGTSRGFPGPPCSYPSLLRAPFDPRRTAKPWGLYKVFIEMSSRPGELVIDPFCGTNPLKAAIAHVSPPRRWMAADLLSEKEVEENLKNRPGRGSAGLGGTGHAWKADPRKVPRAESSLAETLRDAPSERGTSLEPASSQGSINQGGSGFLHSPNLGSPALPSLGDDKASLSLSTSVGGQDELLPLKLSDAGGALGARSEQRSHHEGAKGPPSAKG